MDTTYHLTRAGSAEEHLAEAGIKTTLCGKRVTARCAPKGTDVKAQATCTHCTAVASGQPIKPGAKVRTPRAARTSTVTPMKDADGKLIGTGHAITQRRLRKSTGTTTQVMDLAHPDSEEPMVGNRWATKCLDHGSFDTWADKGMAKRMAAAPDQWCAGCVVVA